MRVLVTGAGGFIGRALVQRLLASGLGGQPVTRLTACDLSLQGLPTDERLRPVPGSVAEPGVLEQALAEAAEVVFHLASMPGGAAERAPVQARRVNLDATARLLDLLAAAGDRPRLVFASTVAVYGDPLPCAVDESTPPRPSLSYGAHKLAAEVLVADATRRGDVAGCSLRLPGIVARPGDGAGLISAFMSRLFWALRDGVPLVLPVSAQGMAWWMSVGCCVDNLLHAACADAAALAPSKVVQLPALHLSMQEVIDALARAHGPDRAALVRFEPDEHVQRLFASYPPLLTPEAERLGFRHDGNAGELVRRATAG
ncbi:NAD-dependent epimerase/dehydratase family protein [Ideonella sp. DXS29W]|uniref:NAD-dependent epimerase/dehydratase family protein n=1 Tax=Ideonella lacteola TaxID=2984193 RepID=A0ABU9BIJ2_9BURK